MGGELATLIEDILCGSTHYLGGIQNGSASRESLFSATEEWAILLQRRLDEVVAGLEPLIRQSIFMSLLPAEAFEPHFAGSVDVAIDRHLAALGLEVSDRGRLVLRDACINARQAFGMNSRTARSRTWSLADLRARPAMYQLILVRQNSRCLWCGVPLSEKGVRQTLEHVAPKHLGDDLPDGSNWALACESCNEGKGETLAWSARAEAHDFLGRLEFEAPRSIARRPRWAVLMRERRCSFCFCKPAEVELWVYRRINTGLPIPANCAVACEVCAAEQRVEVLVPDWASKEQGRRVLAV